MVHPMPPEYVPEPQAASSWDDAVQVTIKRTFDPAGNRDVFTVSDAPPVVLIGKFLLEDCEEMRRWCDTAPLTRGGDLIRWRFDNCRCAYRILEYSWIRDAYLCERLAAL